MNRKTTDRIHHPEHDSNLTRRQFIEQFSTAGLALSGLGLLGCDVGDIISPVRTPTEIDSDVPALIIGSGFGGAVTALRLGEAGIPTMVLERGKRWNSASAPFSPNFPPDGRSTWLRNKTVLPFGPSLPINRHTGVLDRVDYENMHVYRGAAVGGGSIVYGGVSLQPPEDLFYQIFPSSISYQELLPYYERVRHILNITTVPADIEAQPHYDYTRVFTQLVNQAGIDTIEVGQAADWDIVRAEIDGTRPPAAIIGEILYGGNSGYKNSLDKNYLPMAEATGYVRIHPLHRVIDITAENSGKYVVTVEQIDETGEVIQTKKITATYLFLAAGSIGTTELLVKARELGNLPNLNDAVGHGWGTNGNLLFSTGVGVETGKQQGGPVITAILDRENTETPALIESPFFPVGVECRCLMLFMNALQTERGHFFYDTATHRAELMWPAGGHDRAARAAADFVERLNAANKGQLGLSAGIPADLPISPPDLIEDITFTPLGGMVMDKACDLYGRVHGYSRMYIMDGSLLPGSCATANPSLTIAALAERNIQTILAEDFVSTG